MEWIKESGGEESRAREGLEVGVVGWRGQRRNQRTSERLESLAVEMKRKGSIRHQCATRKEHLTRFGKVRPGDQASPNNTGLAPPLHYRIPVLPIAAASSPRVSLHLEGPLLRNAGDEAVAPLASCKSELGDFSALLLSF